MKNKQTIILASKSPRRKELLKKIIKSFKIIASCVDENSIKAKTPEGFALLAALAKADNVSKRYKKALVIAADTIVVINNIILGKPKTRNEAKRMLTKLSGKTHKVITAVAMVNMIDNRRYMGFETTLVKMKKMKPKEIDNYIKTGSPMDKAGAYGIQDMKDAFIKSIKGDYNNVVGFPDSLFKKMLKSI